MEMILRKFMTKEDIYKLKLIKKYAKIRFRRFIKRCIKKHIRFIKRFRRFIKIWWNEWGISKEDALNILACLSMFMGIFAMYILGCMFY